MAYHRFRKTSGSKAFQINYTDYKSNIYKNDSTVYIQFRMYHSPDGKNWQLLADLSQEKQDRPNAYVELTKPVKTRYIKFEHVYVPTPNLAISDIRVFGQWLWQSTQNACRIKSHPPGRYPECHASPGNR
jgi:xylan 1,4-beta-xylosidase